MSFKQLTLRSSEGEPFKVDRVVAEQSQLIRKMLEVRPFADSIPLPEVTGPILSRVIECWERHAKESLSSEDDLKDAIRPIEEVDIKAWDATFLKVDLETLFDIIRVANYLDIKNLLVLGGQAVADMIKGCKTAEEICRTVNVKDEFTLEEEKQVRKANQWAFK